MKQLVFVFFILGIVPCFAQHSWIHELDELMFDYICDTSIVRSYNDSINVIMSYGHSSSQVLPEGQLGDKSTFILQDFKNNTLTRIVDLPGGYRVNDVRFVTLFKQNFLGSEDFCCFCGTRLKFEGIYYYPSMGNEPIQYTLIFSQHGFAGFFSMEEALSPQTTHTAKVRDIVDVKSLDRMTCYTEGGGLYHNCQTIYVNNAVLDIIGNVSDALGGSSVFARVKFYPDYLGTLFWDNNIRYNNDETFSDITGINDHIVTVSYLNGIDTSIIIRSNDREDHQVDGGLELSPLIYQLNLNTILLGSYYVQSYDVHFMRPLKVCPLGGNEFSLAFLSHGIDTSTFNFRYDLSSGLSLLDGIYLGRNSSIVDLDHIVGNNTTSMLFHYGMSRDSVLFLDWNNSTRTVVPVSLLYDPNYMFHSLCNYIHQGNYYSLWSGIDISGHSSPYLMAQKIPLQTSCLEYESEKTAHALIDHVVDEKKCKIQRRYTNDTVSFPNTRVHFSPHTVTYDVECEMFE